MSPTQLNINLRRLHGEVVRTQAAYQKARDMLDMTPTDAGMYEIRKADVEHCYIRAQTTRHAYNIMCEGEG